MGRSQARLSRYETLPWHLNETLSAATALRRIWLVFSESTHELRQYLARF